MSRFIFLVSVGAATLLAALLGAMNTGRVHIELAFVHLVAPLGVALVFTFVIGLLAGFVWRGYWVAELLSERGRLRRALRLAESKARAAAGGDAV